MKQTDKQAVMNRLNGAGMVTPTLAEGQPQKLDTVRDIETITAEIREAKLLGGEAILTIGPAGTEPQKRGGGLMLTILVQVDRPAGQAIGIKEDLAMYCEKFGDARVVSVTETQPEQLKIGG